MDETLDIPQRSSRRNRFVIWGVAAAVVIAAGLVYLLTRSPEETPYRTAPVSRTNIIKEVLVTGHLEPTEEVEVVAPIGGGILHILSRPGDRVEEGQLLARLERGPASLAFDVARAEALVSRARVSEAEAAHARATQALERTERLARKELSSASTLEKAQAEEGRTRASLEAMRAERAAAAKRAIIRKHERDGMDVVAPIAGLVLEAPENVGAPVTSQTRLFRVAAPLDDMSVEAPIGEADIGDIAVGQRAVFDVPAYPGELFEATVDHISPNPRIDGGAVFYMVKLRAENGNHRLLPGMTAGVRIEIREVEDVLAVREAALRFSPEGAPAAAPRSRVWRLDGNVLEEVPVEVGLSNGAVTEVRPMEPETLEVGESIAIGLTTGDGANLIRPGLSLGGRR